MSNMPDMSDWDITIQEYYDGFSDGDSKLEHFKECGDCFRCKMDKHMAASHDAYVKMGNV